MRLTVYLITALVITHMSFASTNESMKQAEKAPLVIDSKNGLVCDKEKLVCTAEGNVKVAKGPYEMYSKEAIAFMSKAEGGKLEIRRVEAHDDVKFFGMENEKATAQDASYDLETQTIDLNGSKAKQVVVWRDTYILLCDDLKIFFKETPDGKLEIDKVNGKGHVQLSSPDELIEGDRAMMTPATNTVDIHGDVRVNRKQGQLRGPHAQVNLDTKVSRMLQETGSNTSERVRVLVFPKEIDKDTIGSPKDKG